MRKLFIFLLGLLWLQPVLAATSPLSATATVNLPVFKSAETAHPPLTPAKQKKKPNLFQKAKIKLLEMAHAKGLLVEGEMTAKQKRQAKWALILGLGSIVLLVIPYAGLLAIPAAITGLVLGIKSVEGNTNTNGIIGIIASGLTLLLFLVAIALVATMLVTWN